jgi:hypothetical protein
MLRDILLPIYVLIGMSACGNHDVGSGNFQSKFAKSARVLPWNYSFEIKPLKVPSLPNLKVVV